VLKIQFDLTCNNRRQVRHFIMQLGDYKNKHRISEMIIDVECHQDHYGVFWFACEKIALTFPTQSGLYLEDFFEGAPRPLNIFKFFPLHKVSEQLSRLVSFLLKTWQIVSKVVYGIRGKRGNFGQGVLIFSSDFERNWRLKNLDTIEKCFNINFHSLRVPHALNWPSIMAP
jgi:hypothetical protein